MLRCMHRLWLLLVLTPAALPAADVYRSVDENGNQKGDHPGKSATKFFNELDWYATALKTAREQGTPY